MIRFFTMLGISLLVASCASTKQSLPLPSGAIPAGKARIQLDFKPYRNIELTWDYLVKDNGVIVGKLGGLDGRLIWDRPAGTTCLTVADSNYYDKQCFKAVDGKITNLTFSLGTGISIHSFDAVNDVEVISIDN